MTTFPTTARPKPFSIAAADSSSIIDRLPPHDLSAEAAVIASMILDKQAAGSVCTILQNPEAFFKEEHQVIFGILVELFEKNKAIDAMILHSTLKTKNLLEQIGGVEYIKEIVGTLPSAAHAEHYAVIVKEKWELRRAITASTANLRDIYESGDDSRSIIDRCEGRIFEVAQQSVESSDSKLVDVLHDAMEAMDRKATDGPSGITMGFIELDNMTDGMHQAEMIVIAARPSVGKTAIAMQIAEHVGVNLKLPVGVVSLEMTKQQLGQRMLCSRAMVDSQRLRRGMLSKQDRDKLSYAVGELAEAPIYIDDTPGQNVITLRAKARRMAKQYGIRLLIIDYLQLMQSSKKCENRQQEITHISMNVKSLGRELAIPVICLSQLNRASESENRMPRTSDLRDSGSIEQDADVVMLLHREAMMHRGDDQWASGHPQDMNTALVIVAKQRNGPCGAVKLTFLGEHTRFANYNPGV